MSDYKVNHINWSGDWADERAREWLDGWYGRAWNGSMKAGVPVCASLAALLREVWDESKNTNHAVCMAFDGMVADRLEERARVLAEVRRVVEEEARWFPPGQTSQPAFHLVSRILARLEKL